MKSPPATTKMHDDDVVVPSPSALLDSLRSEGYEFESAIADIIDNSLAAKAKIVEVTIYASGRESWVSIADDGHGMDAMAIKEAMRLGGVGPSEKRGGDDLGRFGLGLKTASLSQCGCLTVFSRTKGGEIVIRSWDMETVARTKSWQLRRHPSDPALADRFTSWLGQRKAGTVVLWEKLDRITKDCKDESEMDARLGERANRTREHLGMVFHRFLSKAKARLRISISGSDVPAWDPFLEKEPATQRLGEDMLNYKGEVIAVRPYILPHAKKLSSADVHKRSAGIRGWNDHQGFYIYRKDRMLVSGSWLGLFSSEEHYKLARIALDIPNTLDFDWDLDIRKSRAVPPDALMKDLRRIASEARKRALEIYRHRGKAIRRANSAAHVFTWEEKAKGAHRFFTINQHHPLIEDFLKHCSGSGLRKEAVKILSLIERTIPIEQIKVKWREGSFDLESQPVEEIGTKELVDWFDLAFIARTKVGEDKEKVFREMAGCEPFLHNDEVLSIIRERHGMGGV